MQLDVTARYPSQFPGLVLSTIAKGTGYDSNGNVTSLQSSNANGVSLGYTYDAQNRVATVVDRRQAAGPDTTTYTYDPTGNQAAVTYGNGVQQAFAYDAVNRLTQAPLLKGAAQFRNYTYGRATTGHILSVTENSGRSATYGFDNAWRLTSEAVASDPAGDNGLLSFGLDPANNRLSLASTLSGILSQSFNYIANDQVQGETYDNNGNTLTSGGKTYGWDFENRLESFNGGAVTMVYDGDGARVAKTTAGGTTRYLVDELNLTGYEQVVEELQDGVVQRRYAYGLRRTTETQLVNGSWATHWYGYDGEGHVRALTDATGTVTDTYDYDAFGNVVGSTGTTPNVYRYRGEQWDGDLGLYYLRARWYNPVTGRFLSRDPLDTGNKYTYAAADPVNGSDPSGLLTQWTIPAAGGEVLYAYTVKVIVYGSAAYSTYAVGHYTPVGRDFICILKSAISAALASSELEQGYFGLALDAYANGCRVPAHPIPGTPVWVPYPGPTGKPRAPIDESSKPKPQEPDNCPQPMREHHIPSQPNHEIWQARIDALASGYPSVLTVCRTGEVANRTAWSAYRRTRPDLRSAPSEQIDEYPYATTVEGGIFGGTYPFLKRVDARQNASEGRSWGWSIFGLPDGCQVRIVIDP